MTATITETKTLNQKNFDPTQKYIDSGMIHFLLFILNIIFFFLMWIIFGLTLTSFLLFMFSYLQSMYIYKNISIKEGKLQFYLRCFSKKVLNETPTYFEKTVVKSVCTEAFYDYSSSNYNYYRSWKILYSNKYPNEKVYQSCKVDGLKLYNIFYPLIKNSLCDIFFTTYNRVFFILNYTFKPTEYLILDCGEIESVKYKINSLYKNLNNTTSGLLVNATIKRKDGLYINLNNVYAYHVELIIKAMQKERYGNNNYDCIKGQLNNLRKYSKKRRLKRSDYRILYKKARRTAEEILEADLQYYIRLMVGMTHDPDEKMHISWKTKVDMRLISFVASKMIDYFSKFEKIIMVIRILLKL